MLAAAHHLFAFLCHGLPLGLVVLDELSRVVAHNDVARAILDERDGLTLAHGRPVASDRDDAAALHDLLTRTCASPGTAGTIHLTRRAPRRPLTVFVTPLRWPEREASLPAALLLMSDPDREPAAPQVTLERLYGLTRSEADVVMLILDGADTAAVARARGTSLHTARTHIKRILGKVGVQSRRELVTTLLAGPTVRSAAQRITAAAQMHGDASPVVSSRALASGGRER